VKAIYTSRQPLPPPQRRNPGVAQRPISDAMGSPVLCARGGTLLGDALQAMVRSARRHLVVIDDAGRCIGVLADRAVAATLAHDPAAFSRDPVTAAMDPHPAAFDAQARIADAARLVRAAGDDAVVVTDAHGVPIGTITGSDLIGLLGD
jgi:CBS domain-containing protein